MADVFLSYARADANLAARVAAALEQAGFSVWFDRELPAHRSYSDVIDEQLDIALAVVVLWSQDAARSQWVRAEANRARESGRLVQVCLDDARLPLPFDQIQCPDLRQWRGDRTADSWRSVEASVTELLGRTPVGQQRPPAPERHNRRALLIGGGATVAAVGFVGWRWLAAPAPPPPEAQLLIQKGMDALQSNDALDPEDEGSTAQAIALLTEATQAAPTSSVAWGALSLAYAARKRAAPLEERSGLESRGLAAAKSALALDPNEPRALAAQQLMRPLYRHWRSAELDARRSLDTNPRFPILLFVLSDILGNVGRWGDAAQLSNRLDRTKFLLPGADRKVIINLWSSGDLQGADEALRSAAERWPKHRQIWRTQIAYLLYSGRPDQALAILRDAKQLPPEIPSGLVAAATATAMALSGRMSPAAAVKASLEYARSTSSAALPVAQAVAALGDAATALQMLAGYYFGEGEWRTLTPAGGDQNRTTAPLFQPPMRTLWRTPAFADLLRRIGLEDYWARSGTKPDFRT